MSKENFERTSQFQSVTSTRESVHNSLTYYKINDISFLWQYPTGKKFSLDFNFCYFANGQLAKFNSAYYYIFRHLSKFADI